MTEREDNVISFEEYKVRKNGEQKPLESVKIAFDVTPDTAGDIMKYMSEKNVSANEAIKRSIEVFTRVNDILSRGGKVLFVEQEAEKNRLRRKITKVTDFIPVYRKSTKS